MARLLLQYMKKHPDAKHTAEGIARWWLLQQIFENEIKVVERVLEFFIDKGIITRVDVSGGKAYYQANLMRIRDDFDVLEELLRENDV